MEARELMVLVPEVPELSTFGERSQWALACNVDDGAALVYRKRTSGERDFSVRIVAQLDCGVAELLSLVIELDLMPSWNKFCGYAEIFRRVTNVDYYCGGVCRLPWPLSRYGVLLRAWLLDLVEAAGCMLVLARPPTAGAIAAGARPNGAHPFAHEEPPHVAPLTASSRASRLLPIRIAACALTPLAAPRAHRPHTAFDLVVQLRIAAASLLPGRVLDFFMAICVPWLCRRVLALVHTTVTQPSGPFHARMAADATGVYARIRRATGQQPLRDERDEAHSVGGGVAAETAPSRT